MTVPPVGVPYLAAVLLLAGAGLAKLVRPHDTAVALRRAGLPFVPAQMETAVRLGAAAEAAIAVAAAFGPGLVPVVLVALSYAGFAGFVAMAMARHWPLASCGCFGKPDTEPSVAHLVVDLGAAAAALGWAAVDRHGVVVVLWNHPAEGIAVAAGALACVALAYGALTGRGRSVPPR